MLYRVPAELDFLLPSYPYDDAPQSRPWCGGITWAGLDNERRPSPSHVAWVQAVETEGDIRTDLWPTQLSLRSSRQGFSLKDVNEWVKRVAPPLCMFMPSQLRDAAMTRANQESFRMFAKLLLENQVVAISRWSGDGRPHGSGIIIFPVEASNGLLAGAVFHSSSIPEFTPSPIASSSRFALRHSSSDLPVLDAYSRPFHSSAEYLSGSSSPITGPSGSNSPWSEVVNTPPPVSPTSSTYSIPRTQYLHTPSLLSNGTLAHFSESTSPRTGPQQQPNYVLQGQQQNVHQQNYGLGLTSPDLSTFPDVPFTPSHLKRDDTLPHQHYETRSAHREYQQHNLSSYTVL
ncbi:hypothetical protein SISNIDRAFT_448391 [Sistotremastrum niveocremeum HHB9708]|uniref:Uncharacterized protein n=2 Tax=Sistotremastraceae TaxID=3402574 RepID=A0A164ZXY2_9AGAM|nr:hypothetical protein SISNIDRAFT_448391 [Sistotremastrum niveocremeum HHB9708]KZT40538.1 hypothetical protein SISSUDRAFT_1044045 [Sistotremastrum suecicum HHB10207 ss-3]